MWSSRRLAVVLVVGVAIAGAAIGLVLARRDSSTPSIGMGGHPLSVASTHDLGPLQHPQGPIGDGGESGRIGTEEVWLFGDTFLTHRANNGLSYRTNIGGNASPAQPFVLSESLESGSGEPVQLVPFSAEEQAYNNAKNSPSERVALWPASIVQGSDGNGYLYFIDLYVHPGMLNYQGRGIGIARLRPGSLVAERIGDRLFSTTEPGFGTSAFVDHGFVYSYACDVPSFDVHCKTARVPLDQIASRTAYTFWNGTTWTADVSAAATSVPGTTTGFSVAWNPYLNAYLSVYSEPLGDRILARTAPAPQGPWSSNPTVLFTGLSTPKGAWDYIGVQHASLASANGQHIIVSYSHPTGAFTGEIRLTEVDLG